MTDHYPDQPGYKARTTSIAAAEGIAPKALSIRARVYDALKVRPMTPEEIAEIIGEPVHNTRPRLSELSAKGMVEDSGLRREAMGGRQAIVWRTPPPPEPQSEQRDLFE